MDFTGNHNILDSDLIKGCLSGDRRMQELLYNRFSAKMYAICLRYAGNSDDAQDLLQEGFIKVYKNLDKFRSEGSFEGWMRRVFVNTSIEHFRRKSKLTSISEKEEKGIEDKSWNALDSLAEKDIIQLIQDLPNGYRTVFNLFVVEGYSHREIGDLLGINEGTSKSQLARAKMILQKKVNQFLDEKRTIVNPVIMSDELKYRLNQFEVAPPGDAWKNISASLDEWNEFAPLSMRLQNVEIAPPVATWQELENRLRDPVIPIKENKRTLGFTIYRVAASVVIVTILISGAWKMFRLSSTELGKDGERELKNTSISRNSLLPSFPIDIQKSTRKEKINSFARNSIATKEVESENENPVNKRYVHYASIEGSTWLTRPRSDYS